MCFLHFPLLQDTPLLTFITHLLFCKFIPGLSDSKKNTCPSLNQRLLAFPWNHQWCYSFQTCNSIWFYRFEMSVWLICHAEHQILYLWWSTRRYYRSRSFPAFLYLAFYQRTKISGQINWIVSPLMVAVIFLMLPVTYPRQPSPIILLLPILPILHRAMKIMVLSTASHPALLTVVWVNRTVIPKSVLPK